MFKLLNRFAWIISITLGLALCIYIDDDLFLLGLILGAIIKKIFLSEKFIVSRLDFFAEGIEKRLFLHQKNKAYTDNFQENNTQSQAGEQDNEISHETLVVNTKEDTVQYQETSYNEKENDTINTLEKEPSKIITYIKQFFSENLLAKIGAILVFLGVVFLMSLIWNQIPATGKILIGFIIGFGTYFTGVQLDKKGYIGESRILLGTGILINFLVILTGKYILNFGLFNLDAEKLGFLATGVTLLFLVLNTIFGVITALVYRSKTLLLFSFIFAYINPFLTGGSMDTPYTMIGYSLIVSLGALYVGNKQNNNILKYSAFIGGNILLLVAPFQSQIGWISILIASAIIGVITIFSFVKNKAQHLNTLFIGNYIVLIFMLFSGGNSMIHSHESSFIFYMISILLFFGIGIHLFIKQVFHSVLPIFIFPIIIVLGGIFTGTIDFVAQSLGIIVLFYLIAFSFIQNSISPFLRYIFFFLLGGFIFIINSFFFIDTIHTHTLNNITGNLTSFVVSIIVSFIFMIVSYYLSSKKGSEFLYAIGTIGTILTLSPILIINKYVNNKSLLDTQDTILQMFQNSVFYISIISVIVFSVLNIILPFINKQLTEKSANIKNILLGSIFGVLFIGFQLFNYGNQYFPGVTLGLSFGGLAVVYFILSYIMMNKLGVKEVKSEKTYKNIILHYLFISISLFSLAIALIFANNPEIISTVWLFEATILFYFYNQTQEEKIGFLGLILFIIGIVQLFDLSAQQHQYIFFIPLGLIIASFVYNLKNLHSIQNAPLKIGHDIFHILGIGVISKLLIDIIPSTGHGWSTLGISLFIVILGLIYAHTRSSILKVFFILSLVLFGLGHISSVEQIMSRIDRNNLEYLRVLQYISFGAIAGSIYLWNKFNTQKKYNKFSNGVFILYSLVIVSYFIYDIFSTTFAITIFWGVLAAMILFTGINSDTVKTRTIGLYLLAGVLGKIFTYDIWYLDNAVTRVIALIIIGILLIIISIKYTQKYGNNLLKEFDPKNLYTNKSEKITKEENNDKENQIPLVNRHIANIDISDISSVKFYPNTGKSFSSTAKNLKKIVKMILEEKPTGVFSANELFDTYEYIIENYQTELSKRDFDMINGAIYGFVQTGGKVEIKK